MTPLPWWMRRALLATGVMNLLVAPLFLPVGASLRAVAGFPEADHPLYPAVVGLFVLLFGCGYLRLGVTGDPDRLLIALAAAGKLGFVALLVWYWAVGQLPARAPLLGAADLPFGVLFSAWLLSTRGARARLHGAAASARAVRLRA